MEGKELNLNKEYMGGDGFIDRSKVRILLCDNDNKSLDEVFTLLLKCSYQVTSVKSARQVIDVLNAEGPDIDIILAEVDLPMKKGMKMLKYIMRDKELRRIPVIMMSAQDEVPIVVKCLRLGAADYLVKPLRTNELLNLWTHMWRRRRMVCFI
ncbi:two-component response regulator-like APRR1 [Carica papaya]|uniref:two-component response regulator-like APRR1 n=1 Tax=Carica papaya TaxID=3649 RepID=UPI000B8C9B39|nr:two-component response regulator-like APRR1 [Carica papaya]